MRLFVSYARQDRPTVEPLAQRLRQVGNTVWLDTDLSGGQVWWDKIIDQVRRCDAVLTTVSRASLKSPACTVERRYAMELGKSVLPLTIEQLGSATMPTDIARLQALDYSRPSDGAAFTLIEAINRLPEPRPLPNPLPPAPRPPTSYWDTIADQLAADVLTLDQQLALIGRLEGAFAPTADPADQPTAFEFLSQMERRTDLYAAVDRRITALRNSTRSASVHQPAGGSAPGPSGPATPPGGLGPSQAPGAPCRIRRAVRALAARPIDPAARADGPRPTAVRRPDRGRAVLAPPLAGVFQPPNPAGWPGAAATVPAARPIIPRWGMAIWALILFWPLGIAALISAAQVRPGFTARNFPGARQSASRVRMFFWISLAVGILVWLFVIGATSSGSPQYGALLYIARP